MARRRWILLALLLTACGRSDEGLRLRNVGMAQLENERPIEAEATFRKLLEIRSDDPLPHANLAVALLRQQRGEEALAAIDAALKLAPGRGDLLAIRGDIFVWEGEFEAALESLDAAFDADSNDPEIVYALYRHATSMSNEKAAVATRKATEVLYSLRPENLVVLLAAGEQAIAGGDRATASAVYLRIRELLWQADPAAGELLRRVLDVLEGGGELAAARGSALRLGNLLKITPMFKSSMAEVYQGIQGIPVERFVDEPESTAFGDPVDVYFEPRLLAETPGWCLALESGDFDGDGRPDIARLSATQPPQLEIRLAASDWQEVRRSPSTPVCRLLLVDLDNDGALDLLGFGKGRQESEVPALVVWRGAGDGSFVEATAFFDLEDRRALAVEALDFDSDGDLDLALAEAGKAISLYLNTLEGPLRSIESVFSTRGDGARTLLARDLDRDGDTDLLLLGDEGVGWLYNSRQGSFLELAQPGLDATVSISADFSNDGRPELLLAGDEILSWFDQRENMEESEAFAQVAGVGIRRESGVAFDADNDGRLDLALAGDRLQVLLQRGLPLRFETLDFEAPRATEPLLGLRVVLDDDFDGDGDLDLVASGAPGLVLLDNVGGNTNRWLSVRLQGLKEGNDKNNGFGRGAAAEVRVGQAYQYREVTGDRTHFGLGSARRADSLKVVWANGVPQHRLHPEVDQRIVEEQVLKGSCPFLYTWAGEEEGVVFVTDLLWGAPLGMPVAPGVWASSDPRELVRVDGARPREGVYDLRITEELWEAALLDYVRLWVVDHPADVEVASTLRILPGQTIEEGVLATRRVRPVVAAWDGEGQDVTSRVKRRDEVYADGYPVGDYQGVAPQPWSFTFDLGAAPGAPVRLLLDGWIFPADASLNLAVAQRSDVDFVLTRLEVEAGGRWRPLLDPMGFPAGKTKTMIVDTPPLPVGASKLRITTSRWLSWDRIAWSLDPVDDRVKLQAQLPASVAELGYRGFSRLVREAPNAPHTYDYTTVEIESPWLPFPGRYTRYGEVGVLLESVDDRLVILGAGDELRLSFDARELEPLATGWRRSVFLESHGWDKDADRNTYEANQVEPLPFAAMSGYPYADDELYPSTPFHEEYRRRWLTREVRDQVGPGALREP